jgi:hypothetical protein
MIYDKSIPMPEIAGVIADVAEHLRTNRLGKDESLFIPDFPFDQLPALNAAILSGFNVGFCVQSDAVFGGRGVRIWPMYALRDIGTPMQLEQRKVGDWTATRAPMKVWADRFAKWFGYALNDLKFYWYLGKVVMIVRNESGVFEVPPSGYELGLYHALAFAEGNVEHYINDRKTPDKLEAVDDWLPYINTWVGVKQVVWMYNVTDDSVHEFENRSMADYEMDATGIKAMFEDAPLIAWLAYNATHNGNTIPVYESVSESDLEDL